jgi:protein phosphatase
VEQDWKSAVMGEYVVVSGLEEGEHHRQMPVHASSHTSMQCEVAALSDVGHKRSNNEDSFGYDLAKKLFVVCDGMGGLAAGEIASRIAVDQLLAHYSRGGSGATAMEDSLHEAIVASNMAVWAVSQTGAHVRGMGTTLVAACLDQSRIVIGNVGDSRAYFLREGACAQITQDHSVEAEQIRLGLQGDAASLRQFITRAVGVGENVQPDFFTAEVGPGDSILLATDGLTHYADGDKIAFEVSRHASAAEACAGLVEIAKSQGAEDNVTCLLLRLL